MARCCRISNVKKVLKMKKLNRIMKKRRVSEVGQAYLDRAFRLEAEQVAFIDGAPTCELYSYIADSPLVVVEEVMASYRLAAKILKDAAMLIDGCCGDLEKELLKGLPGVCAQLAEEEAKVEEMVGIIKRWRAISSFGAVAMGKRIEHTGVCDECQDWQLHQGESGWKLSPGAASKGARNE